jgi:predicted glycosyltransferase
VVEPAIKFLKGEREPIHPYSHFLFNENESFESWGKDFMLDPIEVIWNISKQLNANFMVFSDAIHHKQYDLIVGDESWEILEYLGHNDMLKTAPFVFITDVIGSASINSDQQQNAIVKDMIRRFMDIYDNHAQSIDLSIYIGRPEDIPDQPFHPEIPINRRDWTKKYFQFPGYILPFDTNDCKDRQLIRNEESYLDEEIIILVSVGGTGLGLPLIQKCLEAYQIIKETNSNYRMIVICGPRIEHEFENIRGVEFKSFVQDPIGLYSSCDVGITQGGLTTSMEMTALGCPFIYFPLIDHFEQQLFVDFRLNNYNAGIRMDYNDASPSDLAEKILEILNAPINYLPVNNDGAQKAANMIIDLVKAGK